MSGTTPQAPAGAAPNAAAAAAPVAATFSQADLDQARAAGASAERERVTAILGHARASTHLATAMQCISTGLSAEQAGAILATLPETAQASGTGFAAAMAALPNPAVSGVEASAPSAAPEAVLSKMHQAGVARRRWCSSLPFSEARAAASYSEW